MIFGCLCVHECPLLPMLHLVSCSGTHVKSLRSASCLEPFQTGKRPCIEHSASRHKTASHFPDIGNGTLFATTQGTYLLQTPCVLSRLVGLERARGSGMQVPGRALGCLPDNVGDARWLRACQRARVAPPPYGRPQVCQISFGHVPLARARALVHEAIRPFRPWPCGPFP